MNLSQTPMPGFGKMVTCRDRPRKEFLAIWMDGNRQINPGFLTALPRTPTFRFGILLKRALAMQWFDSEWANFNE